MTPLNSKPSIYDASIKLFILWLIIIWCLLLMYPFISVIMWSLIFAMALHPLHKIVSKKIGGRPKLASLLIIVTLLLIVIVPTTFMISSLVEEVKNLRTSYHSGELTIPPPTLKVKEWPILGEKIYEIWKAASVNISQLITKHNDQIIALGKNLVSGILTFSSGVLQILISLVIAGILLTMKGVGESIRKFFRKVGGENGDELADITLKTVSSVVKGILGESLVMAVLFGIAFVLSSVPMVGIWTVLVFIFAVVQIPTIFITLPMILYFFSVKEPLPASIWSIVLLLVGASDSVLTPLMLGKGAPVPMLVIFIGAIGGFILSGFIGLFTGAIIMSLGYNLFINWMNNSDTQLPLS